MSGDVQPRKRKDKKRKKDELGVEEPPRGTAAVFGEGDVFIHSHHDHATGGHWCAKVIFFALLAILVTLIGLIILENRGLSELEANSVESRYSGVLEGWLEEAPEDDHHDEQTLELKHHDDDQDDHDDELDDGDEDEHGDHEEADDDDRDDQHEEQDLEEADDEAEDERTSFGKYLKGDDNDEEENEDNQTAEDDDDDKNGDDDTDEDDDDENFKDYYRHNYDDEDNDLKNEQNDDDDNDDEEDDDNERSIERNYDDDDDDYIKRLYDNERDDSGENDNNEDDDHEEEEDEPELEIENIEREASEEEPISTELPPLPETDDDDDDDDDDNDDSKDGNDNVPDADDDDADNNDSNDADDDDGDEEYLEQDVDDDEPPIERITAPSGKPFDEVEEETSSEKPPDTLEEEEEYEKRQEELRREEEQASHMWLKLGVGGALLLATHAIMRRATGPRDVPPSEEDVREETPLPDRRMTLIPEEPPTPEISKRVSGGIYSQPIFEEVVKKIPFITKSAPTPKQVSDEEDEQAEPEEDLAPADTKDKELYSDDDEPEEEFEPEIVNKSDITEKKSFLEKKSASAEEEDDPDDVEIIDDEQLEEEIEEEDDDISDVDDVELLTRLEAKYGRLPEPERPTQKHKDGGNSLEDDWPGEPSDAFWRQQLESAEQEIRQGGWLPAAERLNAAELRGSARARFLRAQALDRAAETQQDNRLLTAAIAAYLELLKMHEKLSDKRLLQVTERALDRIRFRGTYMSAEPVYRLLIRRFPGEVLYRNNLTVSFLMANRADLAAEVLKETLKKWPDDRVALAQYGFVLKTQYNKLEEAVDAFQKALEGDKGPANEPRFYYHLGDSLLLLGRFAEAHEVHKRGAALGHFLSPGQRSLYNVARLRSKPWWNVQDTPYLKLARSLEKSWKEILKEGEAARVLYEKEKEGLKERGEWSQLDLFVRGREIPGRCSKAPMTCNVVKQEVAAAGCRRGQVKFSLMEAGTHVRPHVGPTNCRLRMHLALSNTKDTYIRVDKETRQWQTGKVFMFDDSFEHEVWHNGTGARLVLIVDVWHPDLTTAEKRQLPAI